MSNTARALAVWGSASDQEPPDEIIIDAKGLLNQRLTKVLSAIISSKVPLAQVPGDERLQHGGSGDGFQR
jgi:hypothetical protein